MNLDVKLGLSALLGAVMLVLKDQDQILVRGVHIKVDVVIFCGVLGLHYRQFIARVLDLDLADLRNGILLINTLLAEVKVVVVEDHEPLRLDHELVRVGQNGFRHRSLVAFGPCVQSALMQEKGRELVV